MNSSAAGYRRGGGERRGHRGVSVKPRGPKAQLIMGYLIASTKHASVSCDGGVALIIFHKPRHVTGCICQAFSAQLRVMTALRNTVLVNSLRVSKNL